MNWTPTKPVSIFWQTLFVMVSIVVPLNLWAFLRIKKAKQFFLIILIPAAILLTVPGLIFFPFDPECEPDWALILILYDTCQELEIQLVNGLVIGGFLVLSIYLVRKWSNEWNAQLENQSDALV
jgi:hypothetical protein